MRNDTVKIGQERRGWVTSRRGYSNVLCTHVGLSTPVDR